MSPDDSSKIWEAIDKLRDSQRDSQREVTQVLSEIKAILGERCAAREAAMNAAFDALKRSDSHMDKRISKLEIDVSLLGLTKARLVGFGLGLAAMSSFLTAILMKIVFGGVL
jgi:hypothetical protein